MRWLAEQNLAVSLEEARRVVAGETTLRKGGILVTIDDGFACTHRRAFPILRSYGIPAVAFIPAGLIGASDRSGVERLHWNDVRSMANAGVTIGSHGWSHRSLGLLNAEQAHEEVDRSRREIERRIERPVDAFAYPFGTRADVDAEIAAIVRDCGYACAFTSEHGPLRPGDDPFLLPRLKVEGGEPSWMFQEICRGGLDAWRWVDRTLWKLQASES
jgi:peptidoglycan/xylan/chitin deacetylase (PgdA/CDA1 family)